MIKSFRGKLASDSQEKIRLSTNNGLVGYRIKKFEAIPVDPAGTSAELTYKLFTQKQASITATVDLTDPRLLGVIYFPGSNNFNYDGKTTIIFDHVKFNQDLFITMIDSSGNTASGNYYLELEQVKLDLGEATVATLKDMRGRE